MSAMRKLEREVIRNKCYRENGNIKNFSAEWKEYHSKRNQVLDAEGNIVSISKKNNVKRKQKHNDNGKLFIKQWKAMKQYLNDMKENAKSKKLATENN